MFRTRNTVHRKLAGLIAALAMAVQVLVVGTHVHPLSPRDPAAAGPQRAAAALGAPAEHTGDPTGAPYVPPAPEDCPLCVALSLAGNAIAAAPPTVVPPAAFAVVFAAVPADRALLARCPSPFAARAPPVAIA